MKVKTILLSVVLMGMGTLAFSDTFSCSFSGGFLFPRQKEFNDIYGIPNPLSVEIRAMISNNMGFSFGIERVNSRGYALGGGEDYPLRLYLITVPVGMFFRIPYQRFLFSAGLGASYGSIKEKWETVDISRRDKQWGTFAVLSAEFRVIPRLFLMASLKYESLPVKSGSLLFDEVNLGGVKFLAGVSVHPF